MSDRITIPETLSFVLSVNDGPTMDRGLFEWLISANAAVLRANSTQRALQLFNVMPHFNVVVTNLRRKEGGVQNNKAGIELAASIRRLGHKVPIILYSMNIDQATKMAAIQAGINHITVVPGELREYLKRYL